MFMVIRNLAVAGAATGYLPLSAARHVWLAGAVGLMSLAVMTAPALATQPKTAIPLLENR